MRMRFKVGDRVTSEKYGLGVVHKTREDDAFIVRFDNQSDGLHGGYTFHIDIPKRCWIYSQDTTELKKATEPQRISTLFITIVDNVTTLTDVITKKSATATCAPSDTFDEYTGIKIALDRLYGKEEKVGTSTVADSVLPKYQTIVKQESYKVGDKVKIVDKWNNSTNENWSGKMDKWLGKIMTVREFTRLDCYKMEEDIAENSAGWNYNKYCIEGKVIETTTPSVPVEKVKQVHRDAKVGEYIIAVKDSSRPYFSHHKVGMVFEVESITNIGCGVHTTNGQCICNSEYDVLENFDPMDFAVDDKEIKVGDYVIIVESGMVPKKDGVSDYKNGDILVITNIHDMYLPLYAKGEGTGVYGTMHRALSRKEYKVLSTKYDLSQLANKY